MFLPCLNKVYDDDDDDDDDVPLLPPPARARGGGGERDHAHEVGVVRGLATVHLRIKVVPENMRVSTPSLHPP